jgi:hypothetical protein
MAKSEDFGLPITQNCIFAVSLDMKKKTEHIVIGESEQMKRFVNGFDHEFLFSARRDIGSLTAVQYGGSCTVMAGDGQAPPASFS